ncbi:sugar phosphate nucleotidyltransferase [Streptomyces lavendulae]|uniref:sugar phosphate nucleotidyltransferase n=1 Tax=Streptomyces lavendulae TaxID=1914 RepID=UPI0031E9F074
MKALVLSGRSGTSPRPLPAAAEGRPGPDAGKPVLFDVLEGIADAGILDVGIVLGEGADEVRAAVGDGARFGVSITYLPQHRPLGPAHALRCARAWLGEDDFVTLSGDTVVPGGIGEPMEDFRTQRPAAQAAADRPGVYFFTEAVHRAADAAPDALPGESGLPDVLRWLAGQGLEVVPDGGRPTAGAAGRGGPQIRP